MPNGNDRTRARKGTEGPGGVELQPIDVDSDGKTELAELTADYGSGTTSRTAALLAGTTTVQS